MKMTQISEAASFSTSVLLAFFLWQVFWNQTGLQPKAVLLYGHLLNSATKSCTFPIQTCWVNLQLHVSTANPDHQHPSVCAMARWEALAVLLSAAA